MNPSSVIENGHKTRFASELEDMVFLLTHFCEIEPVLSRIFLSRGVKEGALVFFSREEQQRSCPCLYIWICCRSSHKTVVETQTKPTTTIGLHMNSTTTDRTRKCLQLAPAVTILVEHLIKTIPSKLNCKAMEPS